MLEAIVTLGFVALLLSAGLFLLKLIVFVVLLPLKLLFLLTKGLLMLVIGLPLLILMVLITTTAFPLFLLVLLAPLWLIGGLVYAVAH